jgi:hypothetical protein
MTPPFLVGPVVVVPRGTERLLEALAGGRSEASHA